ncbi:hypothetical protein VTO73DRAFT_10952 [Trametes versicolor]
MTMETNGLGRDTQCVLGSIMSRFPV